MVISAWSRYFVELSNCLVSQLTITFHTFLGMPFHVIRPSRNTKILGVWKFLCSSLANSRFKHGSEFVHHIFAYFTLSLSASQVYMIKKDVGSPKINLLSTFHIGSMFFSFQPILCHPHTQIRITLFHGVRKSIPN